MEPLYGLVRNTFAPLLRRGLKWTIEGEHLIPAHGPAIVAVNHSSYLDPLCAGYVVDRRGRKPRFLAKRELFEKKMLGWALGKVNQIPVDRKTSDAARSLDSAVAAIGRGECVIIFPEGTISLDLEPMAGKTGTARLAQLTGVPVIPMGMWGSHRILFKGRDPDWQWGVAQVACVGTPVRVGAGEDIYDATDRVMEAVAAQVRRARQLYPQQPETGDDDWWVRPPETAVLRPAKPGPERPAGAGEAVS